MNATAKYVNPGGIADFKAAPLQDSDPVATMQDRFVYSTMSRDGDYNSLHILTDNYAQPYWRTNGALYTLIGGERLKGYWSKTPVASGVACLLRCGNSRYGAAPAVVSVPLVAGAIPVTGWYISAGSNIMQLQLVAENGNNGAVQGSLYCLDAALALTTVNIAGAATYTIPSSTIWIGFVLTPADGLGALQITIISPLGGNFLPNVLTTMESTSYPNYNFVTGLNSAGVVTIGASMMHSNRYANNADGGTIFAAVPDSGEYPVTLSGWQGFITSQQKRRGDTLVRNGAYNFVLKKEDADWALRPTALWRDPFGSAQGTYVVHLINHLPGQNEAPSNFFQIETTVEVCIEYRTQSTAVKSNSAHYQSQYYELVTWINGHYVTMENPTHKKTLQKLVKQGISTVARYGKNIITDPKKLNKLVNTILPIAFDAGGAIAMML